MISVTSAGSPSSGFERAQLSIGRRSSPGFANGRRYSASSSSWSWRRTPLVKTRSESTFTLTLDVYGDYIPQTDGGALNTLPEPPPAKPADLPSNVVVLRPRTAT